LAALVITERSCDRTTLSAIPAVSRQGRLNEEKHLGKRITNSRYRYRGSTVSLTASDVIIRLSLRTGTISPVTFESAKMFVTQIAISFRMQFYFWTPYKLA
jgi:hypothetical protein